MRNARVTDKTYEPRPGFEPRGLRDARTAKVLYTKPIARWALERGARPLKDGTALAEMPVGSPEWLVGETLFYRGEAIVLEPEDLRAQIAKRAKALASELGVSRLRVRSS
jgi:predicted DNA-binding transcriptional regulator YafY